MERPLDRPSVRALLDRARARVPESALHGLVMNDPGYPGYIAAYQRVLADATALWDVGDYGLPLMGSFDITENFLLSHTDADKSEVHRWFSVLTAAIELLGGADYRDVPVSDTLAWLLTDALALEAAADDDAPVDLLPAVCREIQDMTTSPHDRAVALLGELLTASLDDAETEARCRALLALHDEFQIQYFEDGENNPFFADGPELVWGTGVGRWGELPRWLDLVERRFPRSPALAATMRDRLLEEGRAAHASKPHRP
ncbi:MAG TPA: hypothetical protein VHW23_22580 [Kofleriaceae bacterium]|jgi:hypothetical protein|nr:hypothetical protein [Kofleriaceae bacterium]